MPRTPEELGAIVRRRRLALGRKQVDVVRTMRDAPGGRVISEPTYRAIETGRTKASDLSLAAVSVGLDWPPEALAAIRDGADPEAWPDVGAWSRPDHAGPVPARPGTQAPTAPAGAPGPYARPTPAPGAEIGPGSSALGIDLEELRRLDPEAHAQLTAMARLALDRARARAGLADP